MWFWGGLFVCFFVNLSLYFYHNICSISGTNFFLNIFIGVYLLYNVVLLSFFFNLFYFIYFLFLAALGLCCCAWAFL